MTERIGEHCAEDKSIYQSVEEAYDLGVGHGEAYMAGYNSILKGSNTENCNFRHFSSEDSMRAWEMGVMQAKEDKRDAKILEEQLKRWCQ